MASPPLAAALSPKPTRPERTWQEWTLAARAGAGDGVLADGAGVACAAGAVGVAWTTGIVVIGAVGTGRGVAATVRGAAGARRKKYQAATVASRTPASAAARIGSRDALDEARGATRTGGRLGGGAAAGRNCGSHFSWGGLSAGRSLRAAADGFSSASSAARSCSEGLDAAGRPCDGGAAGAGAGAIEISGSTSCGGGMMNVGSSGARSCGASATIIGSSSCGSGAGSASTYPPNMTVSAAASSWRGIGLYDRLRRRLGLGLERERGRQRRLGRDGDGHGLEREHRRLRLGFWAVVALGEREARGLDRGHRHRVGRGLVLYREAALRLLGEVELGLDAARPDDAEEQQGARGLRGLELVEARQRDRVLQRALAVQALEQRPDLGADLAEAGLRLGRGLEHHVEVHVAQREARARGCAGPRPAAASPSTA